MTPETLTDVIYIAKCFVYCFFACFFFGFLLHCPKKAIFIGALLGALGYVIYIPVSDYFSQPVGFFMGTMAMSILSEFFARLFKTPATVFLTPAIVSLVPGIGLYQSMAHFVLGETTEGVNMTVTTLINTCAIALAMATTTFVARMLFKNHKHQ